MSDSSALDSRIASTLQLLTISVFHAIVYLDFKGSVN